MHFPTVTGMEQPHVEIGTGEGHYYQHLIIYRK